VRALEFGRQIDAQIHPGHGVLASLGPVAHGQGDGQVLDPHAVDAQGHLGRAALNVAHQVEVLSGGGQVQLAVLDPLGGDEPFGRGLDVLARPAQDEHFHAVVMVEVDVQGGMDDIQGRMLDLGHLLRQVRMVVVEDQGQGADHLLVQVFPFLLHQGVANQVADGLGARLIAALLAQARRIFPADRSPGTLQSE
jgi:hypothetical protein